MSVISVSRKQYGSLLLLYQCIFTASSNIFTVITADTILKISEYNCLYKVDCTSNIHCMQFVSVLELLCWISPGGGGHGAMSKKEMKGGEGETVSQRPYLPSLPPATLSVEPESVGEIGAS